MPADCRSLVLRTFPSEFQEGMASADRSRILGDTDESTPTLWELGGPATDPVHAVLFLFAADEATLDELCNAQRAILDACSGVTEIPGSVQRRLQTRVGNGAFRVP